MTEYLNSDDGLPHTIIDATYKSKYLWWNTLDCPCLGGSKVARRFSWNTGGHLVRLDEMVTASR